MSLCLSPCDVACGRVLLLLLCCVVLCCVVLCCVVFVLCCVVLCCVVLCCVVFVLCCCCVLCVVVLFSPHEFLSSLNSSCTTPRDEMRYPLRAVTPPVQSQHNKQKQGSRMITTTQNNIRRQNPTCYHPAHTHHSGPLPRAFSSACDLKCRPLTQPSTPDHSMSET